VAPSFPSPSPPLPPPSSLLHPTLLEKMRLNSPTSAHMELTTLNRQQTENEINETLYNLQEASPFPKLPPYFVHRLHGGHAHETNTRPRSAQKQPGGPGRTSRPPSGRSEVSIVTPEHSNRETSQSKGDCHI
jgi:hypothetical protein